MPPTTLGTATHITGFYFHPTVKFSKDISGFFPGVANAFNIKMVVNSATNCTSNSRISVRRTLRVQGKSRSQRTLKCYISNFPFNIPNFGPEQIDSIQYHIQTKMSSPTHKQIYLEFLLDTNSVFTLNLLVNKKEVYKNSNLGNAGFQKYITFGSKFNTARLVRLLVDVLSLALDSEGEKEKCVSNVNNSFDDSWFCYVMCPHLAQMIILRPQNFPLRKNRPDNCRENQLLPKNSNTSFPIIYI